MDLGKREFGVPSRSGPIQHLNMSIRAKRTTPKPTKKPKPQSQKRKDLASSDARKEQLKKIRINAPSLAEMLGASDDAMFDQAIRSVTVQRKLRHKTISKLNTREKEQIALELRKRGMTFEEIGERLGMTHVGASKAVQRITDRVTDSLIDLAKEVRALEIQRCDDYLRALQRKIAFGDTRAVEVALQIADRRAKYLGLETPTRVKLEGTGPNGEIKTTVTVETFRKMVEEAFKEEKDEEDKA